MKKKIFLSFFIPLLLIFFSACNSTVPTPYHLKAGTYCFEKATITNISTKQVIEKNFDDILNDDIAFKEWGNLFSFTIRIEENTEYFCKGENRCFVQNEGLAFEIIEENTLRLHFPRWRGNDFTPYDVVIILGWQQTYG